MANVHEEHVAAIRNLQRVNKDWMDLWKYWTIFWIIWTIPPFIMFCYSLYRFING